MNKPAARVWWWVLLAAAGTFALYSWGSEGLDFSKLTVSPASFARLFSRHGLRPHERFEQIQRWEFSGLFKRPEKAARQHRSEGVGNAVLAYYRSHPFYLFRRLWSILRYGPSNRYLTCRFSAD